MNITATNVLPLMVTLDTSGLSLDNGGRVVLLVFTTIMSISILLNSGIIAACFHRRFNSPMLLYIALSSVADTSFAIVGVSCILNSTIALRQNITFDECLFQMFCLYFALFQQFLTTWLMYLDRHWAIFWPYTYVALIANRGGAAKLATLVSTIGLLLSISYPVVTRHLAFCNQFLILFDGICTYPLVARSACGNHSFPNSYTVSVLYFIFILTGFTAIFSTWCIVRKCRKSTTEANVKALHTCFTQLFVSLAYFISVTFMTAVKRFVQRPAVGLILDLIGMVMPATVNPVIFGLRTQEIRMAIVTAFYHLQNKY